jgi:hypothetical protein
MEIGKKQNETKIEVEKKGKNKVKYNGNTQKKMSDEEGRRR